MTQYKFSECQLFLIKVIILYIKTNSEELYMIKFRWAFAKVTSH